MKQKLLIAAGALLLGLGAVGVFLPVWPTTPFVLGAAGCFAGSPKMLGMLKKSRVFREYIEHYQSGAPVSKRTVVGSLLFLWGMLLLSAVLVDSLVVRLILLAVGVGVSVHILWIARARRKGKQG